MVEITKPPVLRISRSFPSPRAVVFQAWSSAEHVVRWFSPETFTVAHAEVRMEAGGVFNVCMRGPDGRDHWMRGTFAEVTPPHRLVIDAIVFDAEGTRLFDARTEATFADDAVGTRLDVIQTYVSADPAIAGPMIAGASEGWRTTLDKLQAEVARMGGAEQGARSVAHGVFHLERTYDAPAARVWAALTEEAAKSKWFGGPPGQWELVERRMDVRVGGRERLRGLWPSGTVTTFDAIYLDVVEGERLVYAYEMHLGDAKISVSLATMQLRKLGEKTTLLVTEQGAFLDGYDDAGAREHGTGQLLDAIGASLRG